MSARKRSPMRWRRMAATATRPPSGVRFQPRAHGGRGRWGKPVGPAPAATPAPGGALEASAAETARRDHLGGDTLAIVAAGDRVILARHLPEPPARDIGKVGQVPWVGPLLDAAQMMIPHLLVVADRAGAHITAITAGGQELNHDIRPTTNEDAELVQAGGWAQRR